MMPPRKALSYQAARLRALGKRRGGTWMQTRIWNWEFKSGQWDYLRTTTDDSLYPYLIARLDQGPLLDLGCGNGTIRCELPAGATSRYVGIDISTEAIAQAEQRASSLEALAGGQLFLAGSITDPSILARVGDNFDVILLRETLYYIDLDDLPAFFAMVCALLSTRGLILIRIWDKFRYASHVEAVRTLLRVVEEVGSEGKPSILIVAAPPHAESNTSL